MPVFANADELYTIVTPYLQGIVFDPVIGPKFVKANTAFRVHYSDPDAVFLLDATHDPATIATGEAALAGESEVSLHMSADDGHRFWMGDLNVPVAMARRKIKIDGPVTKLMGLLPALQPAYAAYKKYLADAGHGDLL